MSAGRAEGTGTALGGKPSEDSFHPAGASPASTACHGRLTDLSRGLGVGNVHRHLDGGSGHLEAAADHGIRIGRIVRLLRSG